MKLISPAIKCDLIFIRSLAAQIDKLKRREFFVEPSWILMSVVFQFFTAGELSLVIKMRLSVKEKRIDLNDKKKQSCKFNTKYVLTTLFRESHSQLLFSVCGKARNVDILGVLTVFWFYALVVEYSLITHEGIFVQKMDFIQVGIMMACLFRYFYNLIFKRFKKSNVCSRTFNINANTKWNF